MRGLPEIEVAPSIRTRRFDALILGGAVPGLVCGIVLAMRGSRVLVVEEEAARERFEGLREPFWTGGSEREGVLGSCLRALAVPLIEQRRLVDDPVALQMVLPDARLDVGRPALTAEEWISWGLCKPDEARALARALADAGAAERQALQEAPLFRSPRRLSRAARFAGPIAPVVRGGARAGGPRRHTRGLPSEVNSAPERLQMLLGALGRALSNHGATPPSPEAQARALGMALEGGARLRGGDPFLLTLLRRRLESLYAEFRTLPGAFRLVSVGSHPAIAPDEEGESGEVWSARVFVLNAPLRSLAGAVHQSPPPDVLAGPAATKRRIHLHLRTETGALPEGMGARVVRVSDAKLPPEGTNAVCLRTFAGVRRDDPADLVASAVIDVGADRATCEAEIEAAITSMLPLSGERLRRVGTQEPVWDDDALLFDAAAGAGWPEEFDLKLPTRQPIAYLERAALAGVGFEGEILLGWRAGETLATELG